MGKVIPPQRKLKGEEERIFLFTEPVSFSQFDSPTCHLVAAILSASLTHAHLPKYFLLCLCSGFAQYWVFGCSSHLGWLIMCVNLAGLRDAHIVGKTLFPGAFVKVSVEETSI